MKSKRINATICRKDWNNHGITHYKDFTREDALVKYLNEHNYPYKVERLADIHIGKWFEGRKEYELNFFPEY